VMAETPSPPTHIFISSIDNIGNMSHCWNNSPKTPNSLFISSKFVFSLLFDM
jgi:hypothetical protein